DPAEILGETTEGGLGVFAAAPTYTLPTEPPSVVQELDFGKEEGFYFLVSCDGNFLGKLSQDAEDDLSVYNEDSDYASDSSDFSIFNPWSVYGRSFTACSAFNEDASYPPQIYFRSFSDVQDYFVGYLTTNNTLDYQKNTCQTLESLSIFYDGCL
ncbi:MAG TPA: hypothetical protein VJC18_07750, partial [bacterium]|nr:hypothetical protein [bacterium]